MYNILQNFKKLKIHKIAYQLQSPIKSYTCAWRNNFDGEGFGDDAWEH